MKEMDIEKRFEIARNYPSMCFDLFIRQVDKNSGMVSSLKEVRMEAEAKNEVTCRPIQLKESEAQILLDSIWQTGLRPTGLVGTDTSVEGLKSHIKDLRESKDSHIKDLQKLVFEDLNPGTIPSGEETKVTRGNSACNNPRHGIFQDLIDAIGQSNAETMVLGYMKKRGIVT